MQPFRRYKAHYTRAVALGIQMIRWQRAPGLACENAAYQRSNLLDARRGLMEAWGDFLTDSVVVPLRAAG
jgi:hypothetical protein